jgi:hypothetical protein
MVVCKIGKSGVWDLLDAFIKKVPSDPTYGNIGLDDPV